MLPPKINVLHVLVCLGGGGVETLLLSLQKHLPENIAFDYLVAGAGVRDNEARSAGSIIHYLPEAKQSPLCWGEYIAGLVREHQYDVVHFHRFAFGGQVLASARKAGAALCIAHSHHTLLQESGLIKKILYYPYHWTANRYLLHRHADHIIGCSSDALRFLMGPLWKQPKCRVILNGIPVESFAQKIGTVPKVELCRRYGIPENAAVIGCFARLDPVKNHSFLLKIADIFAKRKKTEHCVFFIGGEGSERHRLEAERSRLHLEDRFLLPGHCPNAAELLGNLFDCFVLPSKAEGLPVSVIEAAAAGLAVVCSDSITQDITAAFPGRITALPLSAPPERWADAVQTALTRRIPPKEGLELVRHSPMNIDAMANELIQIYRTAGKC